MARRKARAIQIEQVLSVLPCAKKHRERVDQHIRITADFLASNLNRGLQITRGSIKDHDRIYVEWKGCTSHNPRALGYYVVRTFQFNSWSFGSRRNLNPLLIHDFLNSLLELVDTYNGQTNPATLWKRMIDSDGYICISSRDEITKRLPSKRTVFLPSELGLEDALAYVKRKI